MRGKKALNVEIGDCIRISRENSGLTQEQLAWPLQVGFSVGGCDDGHRPTVRNRPREGSSSRDKRNFSQESGSRLSWLLT